MRLTALSLDGFRHAPELALDDLDARVDLPAAPVGTAVADALDLAQASLSPACARRALARAGLDTDETEVEVERGEVIAVSGMCPRAVASLTHPDATRRLVIHLDATVDPLLFQLLRTEAAREPSLLAALAAGGDLGLRIGWLFDRSATHASVSLLGLRIGDEQVALAPTERPSWLPRLLDAVGRRFGRHGRARATPELLARLHATALSGDPERRRRFEAAAAACDDAPFRLGPLALVAHDGQLDAAFGDALVPLRDLGPLAVAALDDVTTAWVDQPDVLVVELPHPAHDPRVGWWAERVTADDATLEQVLFVGARG